jgi:quinoprotein dehydrogenase-associated probable ABC transporter substrate-binding protein
MQNKKLGRWRMKRSECVNALAAFAAVCLLACGAGAHAQTSDLVQRSALRVCADPANLPFSNKEKQGFENKLADLLAKSLNVPVLYTWFPQAVGFVRNTLRAGSCDVIMGYAQGDELVQNTNAYYRSAYALIYRGGGDLEGLDSLGDPRLKGKHIGVVAGTPPATILAANGLMAAARPYQLMVDRRYDNPAEEMLTDLEAGKIDAGLLWGPIAGYYAKQHGKDIRVVPLMKEKIGPRMAFRITMGVRPGEDNWKRQLNDFIAKHQTEINTILLDFGVPLISEKDQLITQP